MAKRSRRNTVTVCNPSELEDLRKEVLEAARRTHEKLNGLRERSPLEFLHRLRFEKLGFHPVDGRELNLTEQLNQTFTVLATLAAAERLFAQFPNGGCLTMNLAEARGPEIKSVCEDLVEAEVFATVETGNNRRLREDIKKVAQSRPSNRFVFFYAPLLRPDRIHDLVQRYSNQYPEVKVQALERNEIMPDGEI